MTSFADSEFGLSAVGRCLVCLVLITAVFLSGPGRLQADDEDDDGADKAMRDLARLTAVSMRLLDEGKKIERQGRYGFAKSGHCLLGASLAPGRSVAMELELEEDKGYCWYAAGDPFAQDVDVEVFNALGVAVAKDVNGAPTATVTFVAPKTGKYSVKLTHFRGRDTSFCALVLMETDGWRIPVDNMTHAIARFVLSAGGAAATVDKLSHGRLAVRLSNASDWRFFGAVMKQNEQRTIAKLDLDAGPRVFLSVGSPQALDIDLKVVDQQGRVIAQDFDDDPTPCGTGETKQNDVCDVTTLLPVATGPALTLTGVLDIEPAAPLRIRAMPRAL